MVLPSLEALNKNHEICAIVTQEDKPRGRGHQLLPTPVAVWGEKNGIDVVKPSTLSEDSFLPVLEKYNPEIIVVIAYGKILPKYVLEFPPNKAVNVHFSLLPKYRGAAPVQYAIINGETETGVCTILMDEKLDTGDILHTIKAPILEGETSGELFSRLSKVCVKAITFTVENFSKLAHIKQNESKATYTEMLLPANSFIDFSKSPEEIVNFIRGYNPHPTARMKVNDEILKVYSARIKDDKLEILEVMPPGKKRMLYVDYIRGKRI